MNLKSDPTNRSHSHGLGTRVEKFFGKVVAGARRPTISGEPKHDARSKAEVEKPKVDREYMTQTQPWSLDALPPRYLHPTTKWYPPIFCLGVALSFEETVTFAKRLDVPTDKIGQHTHLIAIHLTEACGADPPVTVMRGDRGGGPDDCIWLISLATNYDVSEGLDVKEPFRKYCEIVKEAFEHSKEIGWWLEYMTNHDPGHWWWPARTPEWMDTWDVGRMYHSEGEE